MTFGREVLLRVRTYNVGASGRGRHVKISIKIAQIVTSLIIQITHPFAGLGHWTEVTSPRLQNRSNADDERPETELAHLSGASQRANWRVARRRSPSNSRLAGRVWVIPNFSGGLVSHRPRHHRRMCWRSALNSSSRRKDNNRRSPFAIA